MTEIKRSLAIVAGAGLLVLAACGGSEHPSESGPPPEPVKAEVAKVAARQAPILYEAPGTVRSRAVATVSSETFGQVRAVRVDLGDRVRRGQELVLIDSRASREQLNQAEAGIQEAEAAVGEVDQAIEAARAAREAASANASLAASTYRRFQELLERNSVSQQEFDEVEARHKGAQAELARADAILESLSAKRKQVEARLAQAKAGAGVARVQLGYSTVAAPFDGWVAAKHVDPGDLASPGVPLLTLEDERGYRLEVAVEESQMGSVKEGDKVRVRVDALLAELEGRVGAVEPRADPATRSFLVKIDLPAEAGLRSGMFGRAWFESGTRTLLAVPSPAVVRRGQLTGVWVVDDQRRVRFRLVRLGRETAEWTEILSGLSDGETIIVDPGPAVREGAPVA